MEFLPATTFLCSFFIPYSLPRRKAPKSQMFIETKASASPGCLLASRVLSQAHWTRTCILAGFPRFVCTWKSRKGYLERAGRARSVQRAEVAPQALAVLGTEAWLSSLFFDPRESAPKIKWCSYFFFSHLPKEGRLTAFSQFFLFLLPFFS